MSAGGTRLDRWLWSVRLFKTRELAAEAARRGDVRVNGTPAKPSRTVRIGDIVALRKAGVRDEVEVRDPITRRVSASEAEQAMRRTEAGKAMLAADIETRRTQRLINQPVAPAHKPGKSDRAALRRLKRGD